MKVLNVLNSALDAGVHWHTALVALEEAYGIGHRLHEDLGLVVLNYDQVKSSKHRNLKIVKECRSLVLQLPYADVTVFPSHMSKEAQIESLKHFQLVSRAFDRFFNYGEYRLPTKPEKITFYEKLDGSLVTVFWHNGKWLYRTKSMIMPVAEINGMGVTWQGLIEAALNWDDIDFSELATTHSYIFEVVSPYNRIVTRYKEPEAFLLAVRSETLYSVDWAKKRVATIQGWSLPKEYLFDSWEACATGAKELRDLQEGYVGYHQGIPITKVKNPAYVAAHHLRGEGVMTPKRIVHLLEISEMEEYLSVFPEDTALMEPWITVYNSLEQVCEYLFNEAMKTTASQKEFAIAIKDSKFKAILFSMKKGMTFREAYDNLLTKYRVTLIDTLVRELKEINLGIDNL